MRQKYVLLLMTLLFISCQKDVDVKVSNVPKERLNETIQNDRDDIETRAGYYRRPTDQEKRVLKQYFRLLNVDNVIVTGESTWTYNCVANAMGITWRWINPGSVSTFHSIFRNARSYGAGCNYDVVNVYDSYADVDGWGGAGTVKHASRRSNGRWESKLGYLIRILHGRNELEYGYYGSIITSLEMAPYLTTRSIAESLEDDTLTMIHRKIIKEECLAVGSSLKHKFNVLLQKWDDAIRNNPETMFSSDTYDFAKLPEFEKMKELGSSIIPLIMEKMAEDENNFRLLVLYEAIQPNKAMWITYSEGEKQIFEGEQNRAIRTIKKWVDSKIKL